jgi:hypothetical protein
VLDLKSKFLLSSTLKTKGGRTQKILEVCRQIGCTSYLSTKGAESYLVEDKFCANPDGIQLQLHTFESNPYKQHNLNQFVPYMSLLDCLANLGPEKGLAYIRKHNTIEMEKRCQENTN